MQNKALIHTNYRSPHCNHFEGAIQQSLPRTRGRWQKMMRCSWHNVREATTKNSSTAVLCHPFYPLRHPTVQPWLRDDCHNFPLTQSLGSLRIPGRYLQKFLHHPELSLHYYSCNNTFYRWPSYNGCKFHNSNGKIHDTLHRNPVNFEYCREHLHHDHYS